MHVAGMGRRGFTWVGREKGHVTAEARHDWNDQREGVDLIDTVSKKASTSARGWAITSQRVDTPWLPECCQAVNKLSREKIFFAQTHFLESTNQNTNVHTKFPKNRNWRKFPSGCQEAVTLVRMLSRGCRVAVG